MKRRWFIIGLNVGVLITVAVFIACAILFQ